MIIAGAGSGKTRVLTYKIAYLIECGVNPNEILALTFTNKAAQEMKTRISALVGNSADYLWMGTFHSIFARILRKEAVHIGFGRNFTIYDDDDSERMTESIMKELKIATDKYKPSAVFSYIKSLKNKLILPDDLQYSNPFDKIAGPVYAEYQNRLQKHNAMDFDDLLIYPIILFRSNSNILLNYQNRFKFLLVDEFQDTNLAQYEILKMLAALHRNISVVGDDAQSIYRWRGAEIENMLRFESDFPGCKLFKLQRNYRSTKSILSLADEVIKNNKRQIRKKLVTENHVGDKPVLTEVLSDRDEGALIAKLIMKDISSLKLNFKDFVILYRTNSQSRVIEDALRSNSIPYTIVGGVKFYQRREIKDVIAYIKVIVNPSDNESMIRILKLRQGIGEGTVDKLKRMADESGVSVYNIVLKTADEIALKPKCTKIEAELLSLASLLKKYSEVKETFSPGELARSLVDEIGIIRQLRNEGTAEATERMYNIQELLSGISEYSDKYTDATLEGFLQQVSLVTDIDTYDNVKNAVTLMTMHSSKGLEFPVVFVTGLEDGIFPLLNSIPYSNEEIEEERRLFYVAVTRSRLKLYMSYALQRYRFGTSSYQLPSRFIKEIDPSKIEFIRSTVNPRSRTGVKYGEGSFISYENYKRDEDNEPVIFRDNGGIRKGSLVYHDNFGRGRVLEVYGKGDNQKADIEFEKTGVKKLMLKYANLKVS